MTPTNGRIMMDDGSGAPRNCEVKLMIGSLKPAQPLPAPEIDPVYRRLRRHVPERVSTGLRTGGIGPRCSSRC